MIISAADFVALRTSEDPHETRRAAEEEADQGVWLEVIEMYPEMRQWVAHNKTVPVEILEKLATDADPAVRWAVASKGKLTGTLVKLLAWDRDEGVRVRIARNRNAPTEVLRQLTRDRSWTVRDAAQQALMSRDPD